MTDRVVCTRGASVHFEIQFKDAGGVTVTPTSAKLRIRYKHKRTVVIAELDLVDAGGGNWAAEWASDPADPGQVHWWAQSGDPPKSALQGEITVVANEAAEQA